MAEILYGKPVADSITEAVRERCVDLYTRGIVPSLAIIRVGNEGSQIAYERSARKRCEKLGIRAESFLFPESVTEQELLEAVSFLNHDRSVHGCILLLPLPAHIDSRKICNRLDPDKDVDGVTSESIASVFLGRGGYSPCAPNACIELLDFYGIPLAGRRVCVVGRSLVVGRPLLMLLLARDATVTICHTKTASLAGACRDSDILITAAGCPGLITADLVHPGQTVLDVGITADSSGKLHGDVDFDSVSPVVSSLTPVPGGIGVIAGAVLAKHVIRAAEMHLR